MAYKQGRRCGLAYCEGDSPRKSASTGALSVQGIVRTESIEMQCDGAHDEHNMQFGDFELPPDGKLRSDGSIVSRLMSRVRSTGSDSDDRYSFDAENRPRPASSGDLHDQNAKRKKTRSRQTRLQIMFSS